MTANRLRLTGKETVRLPEYRYRVPLEGESPIAKELAARVYSDREHPRWVPDNKVYPEPFKIEERVDLEVRTRPVMASSDPKEVWVKHYTIEVVAIPHRYSQAKDERVVAFRPVSIQVHHQEPLLESIKRDVVNGYLRGVPYA